MDNEVYSFVLKNALNEIRNVCPDIINTFVFREDGEIIVGDKATPDKMMVHVVDAFDGILDKAETIGDVECITVEGSNGRVNVSRVNDIYLVTVTPRKADINYVNTVTRVLIPTVLKLLEKICPAPLKSDLPSTETQPETQVVEEAEEPKEAAEPEIKPKPLLLAPPVNQLIVENLGGLLVPSDTVRIDSEILSQWEYLYEGRKIDDAEVEIETFDGKTARCKVKPIKDSKYQGKGIIQIPEKIQLALEIKKGELVKTKLVVE
jgi:predicted regulator of Ras-like GTPase activity (Roadblock/LC7/MglB family)